MKKTHSSIRNQEDIKMLYKRETGNYPPHFYSFSEDNDPIGKKRLDYTRWLESKLYDEPVEEESCITRDTEVCCANCENFVARVRTCSVYSDKSYTKDTPFQYINCQFFKSKPYNK